MIGRALVALAASASLAAASGADAPRHLIYLHGRIVQETQEARPRHPRFGPYEMEKILATFRERGFVVTGRIRPRSATVGDSADEVVREVGRLLAAGVPADHITVLGASMGAGIALLASTRLRNPDVRFALLGLCLSGGVERILAGGGAPPAGRFLSIREASDEMTEPCSPWSANLAPPGATTVRETVLHTGLAHGFLYRPLPEWVDPVAAWARGAASPPPRKPAPSTPRSR